MTDKESENSQSPKPIMSIRIDPDWKDWMDEHVRRKGITRTEYMESAIYRQMSMDGYKHRVPLKESKKGV